MQIKNHLTSSGQKGIVHILALLFIVSIIALAIFLKLGYFKTLLKSGTPQQVKAASTTGQINAWVLQYIPPEGIKALYPAAQLSDPASFTKNTYLPAISNGTKYHGYSNPNALPAITYNLVDSNIKLENNPPPYVSGTTTYDYAALFSKYDLCNYSKANDIKLVILWAAGSGSYAGGFGESAVTGNKVPTNGPILSGSQYCDDKTILILGLNYERGLSEALESYGHHLESVFRKFRPEYASWADESSPQNTGLWGRGDSCGSDHNPPNARCEYDRSNPNGWLSCGQAGAPSSVMSDCRNWKPDGSGAKEALDCSFWNCDKVHDGENWLIFWMQSMPGLNNGLVDSTGTVIPSWWDYIVNPDSISTTGTFSNLSAQLASNSATFNFAYSGTKDHYEIDMSSSSDFSSDIYYKFASGPESPITETNPTKMSSYKCGASIYWKIRTVYNTQTTQTSTVQSALVNCVSPSPSPSPSPIGDITPPQVAITQPKNGSLVIRNKTTDITASASDNIAVTKVEFLVSGVLICTDTTSPYSCSWKVPNTKNVTYSLRAKAYDQANNSAQSDITVTTK